MSIPVFVLFVTFFLFVGPAFLYWFSRHAQKLLSKRPSFIGFPEDGRNEGSLELAPLPKHKGIALKMVTALFALLVVLDLSSSNIALADQDNPWLALNFLQGTWAANAEGGSAGARSTSLYAFEYELKQHVLSRVSKSPVTCKGPAKFDCEHSDLLYIYQDAEGQPLKAIYFDNEGHVIHYNVSTPDATTVVFLSDASGTGPQFRLMYQRKNLTMYGKFQMRMPGQEDWKSYLEWSGARQ